MIEQSPDEQKYNSEDSVKNVDETVKLSVSDKIEILKAEYRRQQHMVFNASFVIATIVILVGIAITFSRLLRFDEYYRVDKEVIKQSISQVIKNGASLEIVKHVYDVRPLVEGPLLKKDNSSSYYREDVPLSIILNDLCVDYLSSNQINQDSLYYSRLSTIIQENKYQNPFEELDDVQSHYFENLRIKAGDGYEVIQDDVLQIVSELNHKNQLATEYLKKSNTSFIISIVALAATCILSLIQIFMGINTGRRINSLLYESAKEENK